MNDDFTRQSVALSLRRMFEGGHFNICTVREGLKALNIIPPKGFIESLTPLHCVDWSDMEAGFRDQVFERVMAAFRDGTSFDLIEIDRALGTSVNMTIRRAIDSPSKRTAAGMLPFHRRV